MRKAAMYLRVSTQDQTTANQERELLAVAERMGIEIAKVYRDHGISGEGPGQAPRLRSALQGCRAAAVRYRHGVVGRSARSVIAGSRRVLVGDPFAQDRPLPASTRPRLCRRRAPAAPLSSARVPGFRRCRTSGNTRAPTAVESSRSRASSSEMSAVRPPNSLQETGLLEAIAAQRTEVIAGLPLAAVWSGYGRKPAAQVRRSASLLMTRSRLRSNRPLIIQPAMGCFHEAANIDQMPSTSRSKHGV
jgi:hypothetical protein